MITIILNEAPYGSERSYNGFRLAFSLAKTGENIQIYLLADAVLCSLPGQNTPAGYYNIEHMIKGLLKRRAKIHA